MVFVNTPEYIKLILSHPETMAKGEQEIMIMKPLAGDSLIIAPRKLKIFKFHSRENVFLN